MTTDIRRLETAKGAQEITVPGSGTVDCPRGTRALYVGSGGNITCTLPEGGEVTFSNVPDGYTLTVAARTIDTSTTASDIVALY